MMEAVSAVTSTIHPIAVRPRKGIRLEIAATVQIALEGIPLAFSFPRDSGASPSRPAAKSRRLRARRLPIRLVRITPKRASSRMVTPAPPM